MGGAVSLGELVELLGGADGRGSDAQSNIAAHVSRIAGAPRLFAGGRALNHRVLLMVGHIHKQLCLRDSCTFLDNRGFSPLANEVRISAVHHSIGRTGGLIFIWQQALLATTCH